MAEYIIEINTGDGWERATSTTSAAVAELIAVLIAGPDAKVRITEESEKESET